MATTTISTTGPQPIDTAASGAYGDLNDKWARRDWLVNKHSEEKARIKTVTNVVNGDWYVEWPDLSQTREGPTIANTIEEGINHWSAVGGAVLPSIRVPVNVVEDRAGSRRGARKRERRLRELLKNSNIGSVMSLLWGDYAGAGSAVMGAWANFSEPNPAKRNPYVQRFDPRHTYTIRDELGRIVEMLVARKISLQELRIRLSEQDAAVFSKSKEEDVEEWYWYTKDRFQHMVVDASTDGRKHRRNITIVDVENELGFVPVWEVVRPTFDSMRRGIFDQTLHLLRTMQRLMLMTIYSTEEHAFPAIGVYDVANPGDFGPGAIMQLRSAESRIERVGPSSHFDVKDTIARLGDYAREQSAFPQQLTGDPGASIVSARGINASMGQLDARLAVAHSQFEIGYGKVCGFMLAIDETYCDGEKTIMGDLTDDSPAETFIPSRDINGAYAVKATYGLGAGSDPANTEVRLSMHIANQAISRQTYREQLPFLEDPDGEGVNIMREQFQDAVIMGLLAQAQQGDFATAVEAWKLMNDDDTNVDEVMAKIAELVAPKPEAAAPGGMGGGLEAAGMGESLARGGIPGQAEQGPPAQSMGLPPLGSLLGQDSRQVT